MEEAIREAAEAREAEKLAVREAAISTMQRDAALSALSAMQEIWGTPDEGLMSAEQLLVTQSKMLALKEAAKLQPELKELRAELKRLRASEEATRAFCVAQLGSLAEKCAQFAQVGSAAFEEKRALLAFCIDLQNRLQRALRGL